METLALLRFATARSNFPSALKSPTATEAGLVPTVKNTANPKVPSPAPSRMRTPPDASAMARSSFPSPLKSAAATETGCTPTTKFVTAPKVPSPAPRRMETPGLVADVPNLFVLATTRSSSPSPLKSPTTTDSAKPSTAKLVAAPNVPSPTPKRIETFSPRRCASTRSSFPSPLKSAAATETGVTPTTKFVAVPKEPVPSPKRMDSMLLP